MYDLSLSKIILFHALKLQINGMIGHSFELHFVQLDDSLYWSESLSNLIPTSRDKENLEFHR